MSQEFELATEDKSDLNITVELIMVKCERCGTAFTTQRIVDKFMAELPEEIEIEPAALDWLKLCPNCRKLREGQKMIEAGR
jgi:Zn finger protein HypA/HybF involved in hydrogenase expression